jgi:predicted ATP-dependent endonuclease of OLD family
MKHGRTVVLVEGESDKLALEAFAKRRGRDLAADGVEVVPMGGATNLSAFLERYRGSRLAGLGDGGEEADFRRALERAGFGPDLTRSDMERFGFFFCDADLEEELVRALGVDAVVRVIEGLREHEQWKTFQKQPQWRDRPKEQQLRRFFGTNSGRKARAAPRLVEALDLQRVPRALEALLEHLYAD